MPTFMVDRSLPGITKAQLEQAQTAAIEMSKQFTINGKPVRYIRSMFLPEESRCMCMFESQSPEYVKLLNQTANLPFTRIVQVEDLTP